jgi:AcrR family transcriptional regulator
VKTTTSQRLLDTAAKLFWKNGYTSTTTREIAAVLGVQKASLYHHVSRKEDLLYEICLTSLANIRAAVTAAVDSVEDPLDRVRCLIRSHVAATLIDQDMLTELRALSGQRRDEIVALRDAYEELVRSVIAGAQQAGDVRDDIPVKQLSLCLLNLLNWSIFWFQPDGDLSSDQLAEVFIDVFLSGVARKP